MKRRTPPEHLTEGFRVVAIARHGRVDWLQQFDKDPRDPLGRLEAFHLIGRQRIRNVLLPQLTPLYVQSILDKDEVLDLVELAEWDPRNAGGLAYTSRHRRFDGHATPELRVPAIALPDDFVEFVDDWGFEFDACQRFVDYDKVVLAGGIRRAA